MGGRIGRIGLGGAACSHDRLRARDRGRGRPCVPRYAVGDSTTTAEGTHIPTWAPFYGYPVTDILSVIRGRNLRTRVLVGFLPGHGSEGGSPTDQFFAQQEDDRPARAIARVLTRPELTEAQPTD